MPGMTQSTPLDEVRERLEGMPRGVVTISGANAATRRALLHDVGGLVLDGPGDLLARTRRATRRQLGLSCEGVARLAERVPRDLRAACLCAGLQALLGGGPVLLAIDEPAERIRPDLLPRDCYVLQIVARQGDVRVPDAVPARANSTDYEQLAARAHAAVKLLRQSLQSEADTVWDPTLLSRLGRALHLVAVAEAGRDRRRAALRSYHESMHLLRSAAAAGLETDMLELAAVQADRAQDLERWGKLRAAQESYEEAVDSYRHMLTLLELMSAPPGDIEGRLARTLWHLARLLSDRDQPSAALERYEEASALYEQLVEIGIDEASAELAAVQHEMVRPLLQLRRWTEALAHCEEAASLHRRDGRDTLAARAEIEAAALVRRLEATPAADDEASYEQHARHAASQLATGDDSGALETFSLLPGWGRSARLHELVSRTYAAAGRRREAAMHERTARVLDRRRSGRLRLPGYRSHSK
jgi:tetratricopeptide (TPR) repeat protein